MCDKLVAIDAKLAIVPQLATSWNWSADNLALTLKLRPGVTIQDGEAFDATAVQVNFDRYRTASYSLRKVELAAVKSVEIVDPLTVTLRLSTPNALERFSGFWDAKNVFLDRITYCPIPNTAIKRVNLVSGQLDLIERMAASDAPAVKKNLDLQLLTQPALAYQAILFNIDKEPAAKTLFSTDKPVRRAFEMPIDRAVINQVAFEGRQTRSNQSEAPSTLYWDPAFPTRPRDVEGAKKLLREVGLTRVPLTLQVDNSPVSVQVGELLQSMASEAGFDVKILATETNSAVNAAKAGDFQAYTVIWSGRADPDGNPSIWLSKNGFLNWGNYQNPDYDALLCQARGLTDPVLRNALYARADAIFQQDTPMVVLFHQTWLFAASKKLSGLNLVPDGLIRPQGIKLAD